MKPTDYEYTFSVWPDETVERWRACPAIWALFRLMLSRVSMQLTEREFDDMRSQLANVGITLREIERVPYRIPESLT